jgi:hypothetical protein
MPYTISSHGSDRSSWRSATFHAGMPRSWRGHREDAGRRRHEAQAAMAAALEAVELEMMLFTRQPEEIYAASTQPDWEDWVQHFSLT